jgi:hypothetical protein
VSWKVVVDEAGRGIVVPWDDEADAPALGHTETASCWCQPRKVVTDPPSPLDVPIWTHRDPTWPGTSEKAQ